MCSSDLVYTLKVINMDGQPHRYRLSVTGILGMELFGAEQSVPVNAGEVVSLPVRVRVDPFALEQGSTAIIFSLEAEGAPRIKTVAEARFLGPVSRG